MTIRIFIDQGHNPGTVNAGASANGLEEQAVNFEVGISLTCSIRTAALRCVLPACTRSRC